MINFCKMKVFIHYLLLFNMYGTCSLWLHHDRSISAKDFAKKEGPGGGKRHRGQLVLNAFSLKLLLITIDKRERIDREMDYTMRKVMPEIHGEASALRVARLAHPVVPQCG